MHNLHTESGNLPSPHPHPGVGLGSKSKYPGRRKSLGTSLPRSSVIPPPGKAEGTRTHANLGEPGGSGKRLDGASVKRAC